MRWLIFTDLDGTLLDHDTYSYDAAKPALRLIKEKNIPLVLCTSKTRAEIEEFREQIGNKDPFISENGGAIFIPEGYFDLEFRYNRKTGGYLVIELGTGYRKLLQVIKGMKGSGIDIVGFNDMTAQEVADETGLGLARAKLAKMREYDEAFRPINTLLEDKIKHTIESSGLNWTKGGRYWHIMGDNDKGRAVKILTELYRKAYSDILTIALGDSENDFPMLGSVDRPYLVQKKDGSYASESYSHCPGKGPEGWNHAVTGILENE